MLAGENAKWKIYEVIMLHLTQGSFLKLDYKEMVVARQYGGLQSDHFVMGDSNLFWQVAVWY